MAVSTSNFDPSFEGISDKNVVTDRFGRQFIQLDDMLFPYKGSKMSASGGRRWPQGRIPMHFEGLSEDRQNQIRQAANLWLPAGINFVERNEKDAAYLYIFASTRNLTVVGYSPVGELTCELASWGNIGIIAHELGHAIGLEHEQSRSDRDNYISVNDENLTALGKAQFAKSTGTKAQTEYDVHSIMHYSQIVTDNRFVINPSEPTFYLRPGVEVSGPVGMGSAPTSKDIQGVSKFYGFA